jgi:hypothetical protein
MSELWPLLTALPWLIFIGCCMALWWEWSREK